MSVFYNSYSIYISIKLSFIRNNNINLEFPCRKGHLALAADSVGHNFQYSLRSTVITSDSF